MHVLTLRADLRIREAHSLKAKRAVVLSAVRTLDGWKGVAAAEVDHLDLWQRSTIGVSVVSGSVRHCEDVMGRVERYFWSLDQAEVLELEQSWLEG